MRIDRMLDTSVRWCLGIFAILLLGACISFLVSASMAGVLLAMGLTFLISALIQVVILGLRKPKAETTVDDDFVEVVEDAADDAKDGT